MMKKWGKALREKEMQIAIEQRKNPETVEISGFSGAQDQSRYSRKSFISEALRLFSPYISQIFEPITDMIFDQTGFLRPTKKDIHPHSLNSF